jgi:Domain of unknown function (DUF5667)
MAEHRVSMLSASLRRFEDPERSRDPRIRHLLAQLATIEPAPAPRAHFRAELRAQLVAVAPRLVAEGPAIESRQAQPVGKQRHAAKPVTSRVGAAAGWTSRISIARPLATVTAVIAVFAMLLGGAVWVSKKALPGDALYSLKRANENVALSLATDDTAKGHEYLKLAQTRAEEVSALVSRTASMAGGPGANAAGGVNSHTAKLITSTLDSADADIRSGAKLLNTEAVSTASDDPLAIMLGWGPGQVERLKDIAGRLAAGTLHARVIESARLTAQAYERAQDLRPKLGCNCLHNAPTDEFGPKPCVAACTTAPAPTQPPGSPTPSGSAPHQSPTKSGGKPSVTGGAGPNATTPSVSVPINPSTQSVPAVGSGGGSLPVPLPSLPGITVPGGQSTAPGGSTPQPTCLLYVLDICIRFG